MIINSDSLAALKEIADNSIDAVITDPPYGYSFMGKDWDKAVPSVEIWQECLRVLKPGAWCMVMSAPRSDVQNAMISRLMEAGFRLDFTPIYWTYASGFPKAGNVAKLVDKRLGVEPIKTTAKYNAPDLRDVGKKSKEATGIDKLSFGQVQDAERLTVYNTEPGSDEAKALDGSYAGFQPKPAVEVVIVAMKPLSEKTYVDQALKNRKGITWLDDCRVPTNQQETEARDKWNKYADKDYDNGGTGYGEIMTKTGKNDLRGRFPANLLVSDDVLNDGTVTKSPKTYKRKADGFGQTSYGIGEAAGKESLNFGDSGSYSRYFDLDAWARERLPAEQAMTFPFAIFPKASKSEKNKGLEHFEPTKTNDGRAKEIDNAFQRGSTLRNNHHPTVKPLKLMSYLITLTTREGDTVLDPFVGSGTTVVAANALNRKGIGIEREEEYVEIAKARVEANRPAPQLALEDDSV